MNFEMFWTWSPFFVKIWDGLMSKLICLLCKPNNEFHVLNWSFDKKSSNLMHESTSTILHVKSPRKMFLSKMKSLSWFFDDKWNASQSGFVNLMESSMKKVLSLMTCALSSSEKWWREWKIVFLKHVSVSLLRTLVLEWKFAPR